jgi:hypothetical protein
MREDLQSFQINDTMLIVPASAVPLAALSDYWMDLHEADLLKYRWSDMEDPKPIDIIDYTRTTPHMYNIVDTATGLVIADFSLGPFTGKAAQVHFSLHPASPPSFNVYLASVVSDKILYQWNDIHNLEESFVDTLFGITPVKNRVACIFIRKAGFKSMGILNSGAKYLNEVDNALLTTKSRLN